MVVSGWNDKYLEIIKEFGYDIELDHGASVILDSLLRAWPKKKMHSLIKGKTVFVIGAGSSLDASIRPLRNFKGVKIAADSAVGFLLKKDIMPDVIVTDLDGDMDALRRCDKRGSILVVHAHSDNISRLYMAAGFQNCFGTTQSKPYGNVQNFGGFTDGDRSVFLASHFGAKRIILFGMDYNGKIGRHSGTRKADIYTKLKKLKKSKELLEWFSGKTETELFTTSGFVRGFQQIKYANLDCLNLECIL